VEILFVFWDKRKQSSTRGEALPEPNRKDKKIGAKSAVLHFVLYIAIKQNAAVRHKSRKRSIIYG